MKKALLASLLALGLTGSSCLGPDRLYNSVKNWNAGVSDQDWVNEAVFIGFNIALVYPVVLGADVLLFNTVSYWRDQDLIRDPGPFPGFVNDQQ